MSLASTLPVATDLSAGKNFAALTLVARRGPLLRPSPTTPGVFGIDLTAGCLHACPFCHIRDLPRYPGDARVLFDPLVTGRLEEAIDGLAEAPRLVVLSPASDPLPARRDVRDAAHRVIEVLIRREVNILVMTRGRVSRSLAALLASRPDKAKVAIGLMTRDRPLSRLLEPAAASPIARIRAVERLTTAGVPVEIRLEPMIPGLTDTAENLRPLFSTLAGAGARKVVAHYLFQTPRAGERLVESLRPIGWSEKIVDQFATGPVFPVGSQRIAKHVPLDARKAGFAHLGALAAEFGLLIDTGSAQNPDLPRRERAGRR